MLAHGRSGPRYVIGLYRVLTAEQGQSGLGLEAQQASVRAFAKAQGWTLAAEYSDIASGKADHRPGFQAALVRCRQLSAVLTAVRLDRITRRAHTLSQLLEDGYSVRAAEMPGADDLMMRIYAAMAQKERELISERTWAALAAASDWHANAGAEQRRHVTQPPLCEHQSACEAQCRNQRRHYHRQRRAGSHVGRSLTSRELSSACGHVQKVRQPAHDGLQRRSCK
jgi:hypothetical protein